LERVRLNVKQPSYKKEIEKALNALAQRAQLSREDLEELTLPDYGFVDGVLRVHFGPAYAELTLTSDDLKLQWYDEQGNPRKSEPADVKKTYKAERKEFKLLQDEIAGMVQAQKARIERLPLAQRTWSFAAWCERYRDHQLLAPLVHALIWRFTDGDTTLAAMWHGDHFVNAHGEPVEPSPTATVSLWHPIFSEASEVLAWRVWLEQQGRTQPYKQAHREVYLLTDAERRTATYSNRFAAHILRQHQFHALAAARGWVNKLRLMVDDSYPPATLDMPHWGLRAEFWVEGIDEGAEYGHTYLYLSTDQVRFYNLGAPVNYARAGSGRYSHAWGTPSEPIPLADIPLLVFSEVLRDVDLFVGVASVGNDPTWEDGGPQGHYRDYWHAYSFGELSATAETRRDLLSRLLPKLAIAKQCRIDGRFLIVEGKLRTYKIHLGSGNILMEPNDQYLCIVPQRTANSVETLHLPFQGDQIFAVILSKAFMLAEDTKIKDPSIISQINVYIKATEAN
jgi:hypothetical protein